MKVTTYLPFIAPGVKVIIITSDFQHPDNLKKITNTGATVLVLTRGEYSLLHVKLYIFPKEMYVGTANFTDAAFFCNYMESLFLVSKPEYVAAIWTFVSMMMKLHFPDLITRWLSSSSSSSS